MTEDRANNTDMPVLAQRAFDAFVGFVYATTISLVIRTAYLATHFETAWPVILTLGLLIFFSQDWVVRVIGRLRMSGRMTKSTGPYIVKVLLEITIVYFLLVTSLTLVQIYSGTEWAKTAEPWSILSYATALFAISCGVWNIVMIGMFPDVNWKHIKPLFKGHLDKKIVEQFPKISDWNQKPLLRSLHCLVLPYLLVFHVVALNLVLGFFIALSIWKFEGQSLLGWLLPHVSWSLFTTACVFLLLCALLCLGIHFSSSSNQSSFERVGCASLAMLILLCYSACPVIWLVGLVAGQQIAANAFMTVYFRTPPTPVCVPGDSTQGAGS